MGQDRIIPLTSLQFENVKVNIETSENFNTFDSEAFILGLRQRKCPKEEENSTEKKEKKYLIDKICNGIDSSLEEAIHECISFHTFIGKSGTSCHTPVQNHKTLKRIALIGLGERKNLSPCTFSPARVIGATLASLVSTLQAKSLSIQLPKMSPQRFESILEALWFNLYPDTRFKSKPSPLSSLVSLTFIFPTLPSSPLVSLSAFQTAVNNSKALAAGSFLCRDLVNAPPNYCDPESFANTLQALLPDHNNLSLQVLTKEQCEAKKMGAFLAVGSGSKTPPRLLHLTYSPSSSPPKASKPCKNPNCKCENCACEDCKCTGKDCHCSKSSCCKKSSSCKKKIVFIGKGITFDSGGYNIKTSMMELMKFDMGGAAGVFGAAVAISRIAPKNVEVHFISALAENMVSGESYRPSDIITAGNGKTIEVGNTDAEGRLTLADALVYAEREVGPDCIVEMSTLTGAQMIALGTGCAALMCNDERLVKKLECASRCTDEMLWRLPLVEGYLEGLNSKIADINNLDASRYAGSISAGLFLNQFVEKTPYAHIDMAGPVWNFKSQSATGYGTRLLTRFVLDIAQCRK